MKIVLSGRALNSLCLSLVLFLLLSACAQKQYKFEYQNTAGVNALQQAQQQKIVQTVWPLAPETPRYQYLGEIRGEANFKVVEGSEGAFRKSISWLGRFVFGESVPLRMYRPQSGAFDENNRRLYVTDISQKKVFVFDLLNGRVDAWEGGGVEQSFITPIAVAVLNNGDALVTDADLGYVLHFDVTGKYKGAFGAEKLMRPTGITYDPEFEIVYVADSQTHQIQVFSVDGKWITGFGGKGAANGKFNAPTHLAFANNMLHVSDTLNARVQLFTANDENNVSNHWVRTFGKRGLNVGNMPRPKGIAVDSDANIIVVESYYDHLLMFNQQGQGLMAFGGTGNAPGEFDLPAGVWVDDTDKVYVADMFNQRVVVFQYLSVNSKKLKTLNK